MTQQIVLEPLGIVTEPNKLGQIPAGALSVADNVVIRRPGVIENLPQWVTVNTFSTNAFAAFIITPPSAYMLVIWGEPGGWFYKWFDQSTGGTAYATAPLSIDVQDGFGGTVTQQHSIPAATRQPGFSYVIVGDQIFVNLYSAVLVWDTCSPTSAATAAPRYAGLQPPNIQSAFSTNFGAGTCLPAVTWSSVIAVVRRTVGDKVLLSAPSNAYPAFNTHAALFSDYTARVTVIGGYHRAGDIVELYRTKAKPNGFASGFAAFQRGEEVGGEYLKTAAVTLTSSHISTGYVEIVDKSPDSSLGEPLYTNQAIGGVAASPPPAVRLMTGFKGHLFGFDLTLPPALELRPKGFWGNFDPSMSAAQVSAGVGNYTINGCTWSNGGTTCTVSPTSQLALLAVGQRVLNIGGTGLNATITAIGGSSFTFSPAATGSGASVTVEARDRFNIDGFGLVQTYTYPVLAINLAGPSYYPRYALTAAALQLPPYTNSFDFAAQPTGKFAISKRVLDDARTPLLISATHGANWDPQLPDYPATQMSIAEEHKPAGMVWSEGGAPEAWPLLNRDFFARGTPCAVASTRDAIIAFYTDAIWRISGTGGAAGKGYDWRADPIATNVTVAGSQAVGVLGDVVYALTSDGLIAIEGASSARKITQGRVHNQLATPPWTDQPYTVSTATFLIADEENNEIIFREPSATSGRMWIYNTNTNTLTQFQAHEYPFHGDYSRTLRKPVMVGREGANNWTIKIPSGPYWTTATVTFADVYADNPFAQRQWQSLDIAVDSPSNASQYYVVFNGTEGAPYRSATNGRLGTEVPRNAPAIGNTLGVRIDLAATGAGKTSLYGFALSYVDQTDRRIKR